MIGRQKECDVMANKDNVVVIGSSVIVEDMDESKIKACFYAERSSVVDEIKALAKKANVDPFMYYANLLFQNALFTRFEYAQSKREKVLQSALSTLLAGGMSEKEARGRLGLGE